MLCRLATLLLLGATTLAIACTGLLGRAAPVTAPNPALPLLDTRFGVHTRLTEEVEEWKIARTLDLARAMGAGWIVEYFPWLYLEPRPGDYDWHHADQVVKHARARGLRLIARIDSVPTWARPPHSSQQLLLAEAYDAYARALAAFATRYADTLAGVIVWNEPNVSSEWGFRPVDPAAYAELLRQAAAAVRHAAPNVPVIAAGLAPTLDEGARAMSDVSYLEALYRHGAADSFDALAAHAYGWRSPPAEPPATDRINFRRVELLRQVMLQYDDSATPIVITEAGWNDHPRWAKAVRPGERIAYTLEALTLAEHWPWLASLNLWHFRLPRPAHNYSDYYALVAPDFSVKPIYEALQARAAQGDLLSGPAALRLSPAPAESSSGAASRPVA